MKKRIGFVSNSSSTSFVIYGAMFYSYDEAEEALGVNPDKFTRDNNLNIEHGDPNEWEPCVYVGLNHYKMELDETKRQFQDKVEKQLPENVRHLCGWYEESYYDG